MQRFTSSSVLALIIALGTVGGRLSRGVQTNEIPDAVHFFLLDVSRSMDGGGEKGQLPPDPAKSLRTAAREQLVQFAKDGLHVPGQLTHVYLAVFGERLRARKRESFMARRFARHRSKFQFFQVREEADLSPIVAAIDEVYGSPCTDKGSLLYDAVAQVLQFLEQLRSKLPAHVDVYLYLMSDGADTGKGRYRSWTEVKSDSLEMTADGAGRFIVRGKGEREALPRPTNIDVQVLSAETAWRTPSLLPEKLVLKPFAHHSQQEIVVQFSGDVPGYQLDVSLVGVEHCTVKPAALRISQERQTLTFQGSDKTTVGETAYLVLSNPQRTATATETHTVIPPARVPIEILGVKATNGAVQE